MDESNDFTVREIRKVLRAAMLTARLKEGTISDLEQAELDSWLEEKEIHKNWLNQMQHSEYLQKRIKNNETWDPATEQALAAFHTKKIFLASSKKSMISVRRWWVAASIILMLGVGAYIWTISHNNTEPAISAKNASDIVPGREGAMLTLADGSQVALSDAQNTTIALQGGVAAKVVDGALRYEGVGNEVVYNTMSTPKGRQFQVTLPDGTNVWLNAASSIRYPTVFKGTERKVFITGEVYFEVAANVNMPFFVNINNASEVEVLGTNFNINAYIDEQAIKTTLLNGSIKIYKKDQLNQAVIVKPGQQAVVEDKIKLHDLADLEQTVAWKNGIFNFKDASLEEFMRQIARWYDLTIEYKGAIPERLFNGKMGRDLELSQILKLLTQSDIKFKVEGNRIIIERQ